MPTEPTLKGTIAFADDQNLAHTSKQVVATRFFDIPAAAFEEAAKDSGGLRIAAKNRKRRKTEMKKQPPATRCRTRGTERIACLQFDF
jgi:hypothetical protein